MHPSHQISSGFIAGTLIHCRDGLRPVDTVRPGDDVLIQLDENLQGYRPVTSIRSSQSEVCLVELVSMPALEAARAKGTTVSKASLFRYVMGKEQPLLVDGVGWVVADELMAWKQGMPSVPTLDGRGAAAAGSIRGKRRQAADEGWFQYVSGSDTGFVLNCRDGGSIEQPPDHQTDVMSDIEEWWEPEYALHCEVFMLRFAFPAIYFVGRIGVAVHSDDLTTGLQRAGR